MEKLFKYIDNPNYRGLSIHPDHRVVRHNFIEAADEYSDIAKINKATMTLKFPSGAAILFRAVRTIHDAHKLAGREFQYIDGFVEDDEAGKFLLCILRTHDATIELGHNL